MNPIAKDALKRAMSGRVALPTSVLDEPAPKAFSEPAAASVDKAPTPISVPAPAPAPAKEVSPMQSVAPIHPAKPAKVKPTYNSRSADKFVVRLPDGLRDRIQGHSRRQFSSMNSFVLKALIREVDRLDELDGIQPAELPVAEEPGPESMESLVLRLEAAVARMEQAQQ